MVKRNYETPRVQSLGDIQKVTKSDFTELQLDGGSFFHIPLIGDPGS